MNTKIGNRVERLETIYKTMLLCANQVARELLKCNNKTYEDNIAKETLTSLHIQFGGITMQLKHCIKNIKGD